LQEKTTKNTTFLIFLFLAILAIGIYIGRESILPLFFQPQEPVGVERGTENGEEEIEVLQKNLTIPWDVVFLPNGGMFVTQRSGELLYFFEEEKVGEFEIEGVSHAGEGGLLGVVLHPDFEENNYFYLYLTTEGSLGIENKVVRYKFEENEIFEEEVIIEEIPGGRTHNGGRMIFGPDGHLYIATGDAGETRFSQDIDSLAGKILRITDEGEIPQDNPFENEIYSYGHRNPQGLVWDEEGRLWSTEHGPTARDELNLIEAGKNYGWPEIRGDEEMEGMESPVLHSGDDYTWAPSGMTFWENSLFWGGLRGQAIYEAKLEGEDVVEFVLHFEKEFGRIRNITVGPDGMFYILTNNTDGRGTPEDDDDKIIRINPAVFD